MALLPVASAGLLAKVEDAKLSHEAFGSDHSLAQTTIHPIQASRNAPRGTLSPSCCALAVLVAVGVGVVDIHPEHGYRLLSKDRPLISEGRA